MGKCILKLIVAIEDTATKIRMYHDSGTVAENLLEIEGLVSGVKRPSHLIRHCITERWGKDQNNIKIIQLGSDTQ